MWRAFAFCVEPRTVPLKWVPDSYAEDTWAVAVKVDRASGGSPSQASCTESAARGGVAVAARAAVGHVAARRWSEGSPDALHGPCGAAVAALRPAQRRRDMGPGAQAW